MRDGWLDSGDVMRADDEGYLTFCGREKQLIVHDGSNISPVEVEDALLQHAAVEIAGVVGVRDPLHGENVRAYVTLKPDAAKPMERARPTTPVTSPSAATKPCVPCCVRPRTCF